jgi:hypothetical protein
MKDPTCSVCLATKAPYVCGSCQQASCKRCIHFLEEDAFSFLGERPAALSHTQYCETCFANEVAGPLDNYNSLMAKAKDINVYFKTQGKETRTLKRKEPPIKIEDCKDYDEAVLRLAFLAAELGFNAIIDTQLHSKKVHVNSYQTTVWSGSAIPTHVDAKQLNLGLRNPN